MFYLLGSIGRKSLSIELQFKGCHGASTQDRTNAGSTGTAKRRMQKSL